MLVDMTPGLLLGAGLFVAAAVLSERHALYIPAVLLALGAVLDALLL